MHAGMGGMPGGMFGGMGAQRPIALWPAACSEVLPITQRMYQLAREPMVLLLLIHILGTSEPGEGRPVQDSRRDMHVILKAHVMHVRAQAACRA